MTDTIINSLLYNIPIKQVLIGDGIAKNAVSLLESIEFIGKIALVSDENTYIALGKDIVEQLGSKKGIILKDQVKADEETAKLLIEQTANADFIVAVGSGTINDLCKYTSFLQGKPYAVFATAPSMNGYASANASIAIDGCKKTLQAHLPRGIFMDIDVLIAAPKRLIRSGLGDSICRSTAQVDWLLSHLLLDTPYTTLPFEILKESEEKVFQNSGMLVSGNKKVMKELATLLTLSGFGMYIAGGSYPASQGEHLIAHYVEEMSEEKKKKGICSSPKKETYHGEQIAVTTLMMARLQEDILTARHCPSCIATIGQSRAVKSGLPNMFPSGLTRGSLKNKEDFMRSSGQARGKQWNEIKAELLKHFIPSKTLEQILKNAGAPTCYTDIGWTEDIALDAIKNAHSIRNRFTFLNINTPSSCKLMIFQ